MGKDITNKHVYSHIDYSCLFFSTSQRRYTKPTQDLQYKYPLTGLHPTQRTFTRRQMAVLYVQDNLLINCHSAPSLQTGGETPLTR